MNRKAHKLTAVVLIALILPIAACSQAAKVATVATPSTPAPSSTLPPTSTPIPATLTPTSAPLPSPTLATPPTRTPAPPAACPQPSERSPTLSPISPWEDYAPQIRAYLNERGSADGLQDALNGLTITEGETTWRAIAWVMTTDVTGDTTPDVLVDLIFFTEGDHPVHGTIIVFTRRGGQFESNVMARTFGARFHGSAPEKSVHTIQDMNRNGMPEILFSHLDPPHGFFTIGPQDDFVRLFQIAEWDGETFVGLIQEDKVGRSRAAVTNGDGAVRDKNSDGILELVLNGGPPRGPGVHHPLYRPLTKTWVWNGSAFILSCVAASPPPVYRFQAVEDGDDAALCGDYEAALASYQRAIFDEQLLGWKEIRFYDPPLSIETAPDPDPDERPRLSAYSRYRILLLHVAQGRRREAQTAYDSLQEQSPPGSIGHSYAELANAFWNEYEVSQDIAIACDAAIKYASTHREDILTPLSSEYYSYYAARHDEPESICPFRTEKH